VTDSRTLSATDVALVCSCYRLGMPLACTLVYRGTSAVYRLVCNSPSGPRAVVVKVQEHLPHVHAAKLLEARVLSALAPSLVRVPVLLIPNRSETAAELQPWGICTQRSVISVYDWVDSVAYNRSAAQRTSAGRSFGDLQRELERLSSDEAWIGPVLDSLIDARTVDILQEYADSERARAESDAAAGLPHRSLMFLQKQHELMRADLDRHHKLLCACPRRLVHADFTPGNCGYGDNDEVRIVFDFESVRIGRSWAATALAVATFTLLRSASAEEVARAMHDMAGEIRCVCPSACPPPALLLPLVRLVYVDAAWRQLEQRRINPHRGWGFLREDLRNLAWLNTNWELLANP
jgi:Ser/Thr protein kinase RdoA (MazF antagonist)